MKLFRKRSTLNLLLNRQHLHSSNQRPFSTIPVSKMPWNHHLNKQPLDANWREAASLIILAQGMDHNTKAEPSPHITFDYQVLMVKRSGGSSFMASAYVFPGGQIEISDFDMKWKGLFEKCGFSSDNLREITDNIVGPRPPISYDSITLRKLSEKERSVLLNSDIALRISAIRETFEEAGILLLTNVKDQQATHGSLCSHVPETALDFGEWQTKVRNDSNAFYDLCDQLQMVPNIWSLYEWSDWLTPTSVGHRRFDTLFYVCCLDAFPQVIVDNAEITKSMVSFIQFSAFSF